MKAYPRAWWLFFLGAGFAAAAEINPLTATPFVGLTNGDIVENVIFVKEFKRAHPNEQVALALPEITKPQQGVLPVVAFTLNGKLYWHSHRVGDMAVPDFDAAVFTDETRLIALQRKYAAGLFKNYARTAKQDTGLVDLMLADKIPTAQPNKLTGDTEAVQLNRALTRLQKLGVSSAVREFDADKSANSTVQALGGKQSYLLVEYNGLQFAWAPRLGSTYNGLGDRPQMNSVLEGILFTLDYAKKNLNERAVVYIHPLANASTPGRMVATAVYTKGGQVFSHHQQTGDLPSTLATGDLANREKVIATASAAFRAARIAAQKSRLAVPSARGSDYRAIDTSVPAMHRLLTSAGIQAQILGSRSDALTFNWEGKPYTYTEELGVFAGQRRE